MAEVTAIVLTGTAAALPLVVVIGGALAATWAVRKACVCDRCEGRE